LAGRLRKRLLGRVFRGTGIKPRFVAVVELHGGRVDSVHAANGRHGAHVHLLLEVPPPLLDRLLDWMVGYARELHGRAAARAGVQPRQVTPGLVQTPNTGLAANIVPVDQAKSFRGSSGLAGALEYLAKHLPGYRRRLARRGLDGGASAPATGAAAKRVQPVWASDDLRDRAGRLFEAAQGYAARDAEADCQHAEIMPPDAAQGPTSHEDRNRLADRPRPAVPRCGAQDDTRQRLGKSPL
jgi:hypothetical protein